MSRAEPTQVQSHVRVIVHRVSGPKSDSESHRSVVHTSGIVVGRALDCDWPIPEDGLLSRKHFRLTPTRSGCTVTDLGTTNGTNLNDEPLEPFRGVELLTGDVIHCGRSCFRVEFEVPDRALLQASERLTDEAPIRMNLPAAVHGSTPSPPGVPVNSIEEVADPGRVESRQRQCSLCRRMVDDSDTVTPFGDGLQTDPRVWVCRDCRARSSDRTSGQEDLAPHFETVRLLGRGSMGVVYLAHHRGTGREVALKIIDPETATTRTAIERFLREMSVIGTLKHPNIVECLDQGHDHGRLWFAMEYVSGVSLETLAQANRGSYPCHQACRLLCQVLRGLEHAHSQGFVHRDIKPDNILIGRTPENKVIAKISDFGLAKNYQQLGGSGLTFSGEMRGTIPFMPPEQMIDFKTVKPSADLYACAATLYYLISGTYVFEGDSETDDMIQMLLDHRIVPLSRRRADVPPGLSDLIDRCLARQPEDRLPTAAAMRSALKAFA